MRSALPFLLGLALLARHFHREKQRRQERQQRWQAYAAEQHLHRKLCAVGALRNAGSRHHGERYADRNAPEQSVYRAQSDERSEPGHPNRCAVHHG